MSAHVSRRSIGTVVTIAGLVLFGLTLGAVDVNGVLDGLRRVGVGFLAILLLAGIRLAARAVGWSACSSQPARLPVSATFLACVVGETLGSLTPLGLVASEPAKVLWVRPHASGVESSASLALETLAYSGSVAIVLAAGTVAALLTAGVVSAGHAMVGAAFMTTIVGVVLWRVQRTAQGGMWARGLAWMEHRCRSRVRLGLCADAIARVREMSGELGSHRTRTLAVVGGMELVFQAAAVAEVYVTLVMLGVPNVTVGQAFLLECVNRAVTVGFKFVPLRLGVDELASALTTGLLGAGGSTGVAVAMIRKARVLCWALPGLVLIGCRGWTVSRRHRASTSANDAEERRVCCEL